MMKKTKKLITAALVLACGGLFGGAVGVSASNVSATTTWKTYTQSFTMDKGAKVLFDGENTGIRFTALMDSAEYQNLMALNSDTVKISFGVVVMPYDYVTADKALTEENLFGENKKYCFEDKATCDCSLTHVSSYESSKLYEDAEKYPGKNAISCSLIKVLEDNLPRPFVGVGYVAYENTATDVKEYKLATFYGEDVKNNVRSALYVAQVAYEFAERYNLNETQKQTLADMYFTPFVGKNFVYTVNYNVVDKDGNVLKTETAQKYAPFNTKISAPDYDGEDPDFTSRSKVQDDAQYLIYNENRTVIEVNYVNDAKPVIAGELPETIYAGTAQTFEFTAKDAFGADVPVVMTLVDADGNETEIDGEYTFEAAGEYTLKLTATDSEGNVGERTIEFTVETDPAEKYGGALKVNAIDGLDDVAARGYVGNSAVVHTSFFDEGGYAAAWLSASQPTETIGGKVPMAKYSVLENKYLAARFGIQPTLTKEDLNGYKKYSGFDSLYIEYYNEHSQYPAAMKKLKVLTGVDESGAGVYTITEFKSGEWHTIKFDIDMLIEHYDTIFYPSAHHSTKPNAGLCLIASANTSEGSSADMVSWKNFYYLGDIYFSSDANLALEKFVGVDKISAIESVDDIAARGYVGNSDQVYTSFTDAGGCAAAWLTASTPTEALGGKVPTVKYSVKENNYLAARFGIQPTISKSDLENYKKYSGLTKLCIEFYNEHTQWPSGMKKIKVLTGVDENGAGVYTIKDFKSGEWHTIEFDIDMLIEHYDTIFYPSVHHSTKPDAGICLIASANTGEGSTADMVSWKNIYYLGEIYFAK